jgi:hypothetical protein
MKRLNRVPVAILMGALVVAALPAVFDAGARDRGIAAVDAAVEPVDAAAVEVARDAFELREQMTHPDIDRVDTALVFTNAGSAHQRVVCVGFDEWGHRVGAIWLRVPAHGLRYARASDLSSGVDFVGSAECKSRGHIIATSVLAGPDLTDLPAQTQVRDGGTHIRFPLLVTY